MASPGSELLVFSTELKGILAHPAVPRQVCRGLVAKGPKVELQSSCKRTERWKQHAIG